MPPQAVVHECARFTNAHARYTSRAASGYALARSHAHRYMYIHGRTFSRHSSTRATTVEEHGGRNLRADCEMRLSRLRTPAQVLAMSTLPAALPLSPGAIDREAVAAIQRARRQRAARRREARLPAQDLSSPPPPLLLPALHLLRRLFCHPRRACFRPVVPPSSCRGVIPSPSSSLFVSMALRKYTNSCDGFTLLPHPDPCIIALGVSSRTHGLVIAAATRLRRARPVSLRLTGLPMRCDKNWFCDTFCLGRGRDRDGTQAIWDLIQALVHGRSARAQSRSVYLDRA
eukprot:5150488-Pleurochrysis_carterae.AAC.1